MTEMKLACCLVVALDILTGCTSDKVDSDEQARRAYLGLDSSVGKSLNMGFDGFNSATSANIQPQSGVGIKAGTLVISGQVDQGASANKEMRLHIAMVGYTDGPFEIDDKHHTIEIIYDTAADVTVQPFLSLSLKNIPTGTLTGTLTGTYHLTGDIKGDVLLNLTINGNLADGGGGKVIRAPGTTKVTGTAMQGDGVYDVNVTL
jgi:hypothetical protein